MTQVVRPPDKHRKDTSFFERLNYYFGKMLTVRDFRDEQHYFNEKRWILNRFGVGWGVLHGIEVAFEEGCILVGPGFALDKSGHEIWVRETHRLDPKAYLEGVGGDGAWHDPEQEGPEDQDRPPVDHDRPPQWGCYYVYLAYAQCFTEPSPVTVEDCEGLEAECQYNRIREGYTFKVRVTGPEWPAHELPTDRHGCEVDCFRFVCDPAGRIVKDQPVLEPCVDIPLAKICRDEKGRWYVDNAPPFRKLAFSNQTLYDLIECLKQEVWKVHEAHYDRKRFVPLLAQTIKGVHGVNGKIGTVEPFGRYPTRITSDGDYIWVTDPTTHRIYRFHRTADIRKPMREFLAEPPVHLHRPNLGLAFDGLYMWVTHPETRKEGGAVTGVNVCQPGNRAADQHIEGLKPEPREIVFTGRYLVVSHGAARAYGSVSEAEEARPKRKTTSKRKTARETDIDNARRFQWITVIDTHDCSWVETYYYIGKDESEIKAMVFDGEAVWAVNRSRTGEGLRKIILHEYDDAVKIEIDGPYDCEGRDPVDITFDGTHIWVSHENGVTKIDVETVEDVGTALAKDNQTAVAFDGVHVWAGEPYQGKINRVDTFEVDAVGSEEIRSPGKDYDIVRICFDGTYLWVIAHEEGGGYYEEGEDSYEGREPAEQGDDYKEQRIAKTGLLHRLIP